MKKNERTGANGAIPDSIESLEASKWAREAKSPDARRILLEATPKLLRKLKNKPVAARALQAFDLYKGSVSGKGDVLNARNLIVLGAALLYFISPIDCIPDVLPIVGWMDDIGVLALAMGFVASRLNGKQGDNELSEEGEGDLISDAEKVRESMCFETITLSEEWNRLEAEAVALNDKETYEEIQLRKQSVQDPLRRVIFAGGFSAGKSSLINALLESPLLKVSPLPCTPVLTTIMAAPPGNSRAVVSLKDGNTEIIDDISKVDLTDKAYAEKIDEVTIFHSSPLLAQGLSFVDTCGLESDVHKVLAYSELPRSAAFVFVKSAKVGSLTRDEYDYLSDIAKEISPDQLIIVINKADLVQPEEAERLRKSISDTLADMGIKYSRIYITSAKEIGGVEFQLSSLREDLEHRSQVSIPAREEEEERLALGQIRSQIEAKQRLSRLDAAKQEAAKAQIREINRERWERVRSRASALKDDFKQRLDNFAVCELIPAINRRVDQSALDERLSSEIRTYCRNSLSEYVKKLCAEMSRQFDIVCERDTLSRALTIPGGIQAAPPETGNDRAVKLSGEMLLPAIAVLTFFPMGLFSWLTTIAIPTFFMDKLGVGTKLATLLGEFGPGRKARAEFKKNVAEEIKRSAEKISEEIAHMIDDSLERQKAKIESL